MDSFKINTAKLVPKGWIVEDLDNNKIKIYYTYKKTACNPKPFIFDRLLTFDEKFYEGLALFLGDGDLNSIEKRHLTFTSIDKDIALHALNFLIKYFNIDPIDITFYIRYRLDNPRLTYEWACYLDIPYDRIFTNKSSRMANEAMQIQVNGVVFRKMFEKISKTALSYGFLKNKKLRRAIIRGLFAAEGNVGIQYTAPKPYITQISFSLHLKEIYLAELIKKILQAELIPCSLKKRKQNNLIIISITNWSNYWKLWKLKLFDLCQRKKMLFFQIMHHLELYPVLSQKKTEKIFKLSRYKQYQLAQMIDLFPSTMSLFKQGKLSLSLANLEMLRKTLGLKKGDIRKSIKSIRIGSLTHICDPLFLDYVCNKMFNQ